VVTAGNTSGVINIFLGQGDGTFQEPIVLAVSAVPYSAVSGDFNGDGKVDLAVGNFLDNSVSVLLGKGTGRFQSAVNYSVGTNPISLTTADLNGDGVLDLATANLTGASISELLGTGTGTFQPAVNIALSGQAISVVAGDFNGDGTPDLAVSENNLGLGLALNDGNGQFGDFEIYSAGSPAGLALGDFDLKRGLDLVVVSGGEGGSAGSLSALLNSGPRH